MFNSSKRTFVCKSAVIPIVNDFHTVFTAIIYIFIKAQLVCIEQMSHSLNIKNHLIISNILHISALLMFFLDIHPEISIIKTEDTATSGWLR